MQGAAFAKSYHLVGNATQFLGLRQSRIDLFVDQQGHHHVGKHGLTVTAGPVKFSGTNTVSHFQAPFSVCVPFYTHEF
jgi:hypothetical protein